RALAEQLRDHEIHKPFRSAFEHELSVFQASVTGVVGIGLRARAAQSQRGDSPAIASPEFEQDVASDRNSTEDSPAHTCLIQHAREIGRVLFHSCRSIANLRLALSATLVA